MKELHVGQKFEHKDKSIFMIVCIESFHSLICIEGRYAGCSYSGARCENINEVFDGDKKLFKAIP